MALMGFQSKCMFQFYVGFFFRSSGFKPYRISVAELELERSFGSDLRLMALLRFIEFRPEQAKTLEIMERVFPIATFTPEPFFLEAQSA